VIRGFEAAGRMARRVGAQRIRGRYWGRHRRQQGQHTINLAARGAVLAERGALGFNAKWLIEMGE